MGSSSNTHPANGLLVIAISLSAAAAILPLIGAGCSGTERRGSEPTAPITFRDIGTLREVRTIKQAGGVYVKSQVLTSKGTFAVLGIPSGIYGESVKLGSDRRVYFGTIRKSFELYNLQ